LLGIAPPLPEPQPAGAATADRRRAPSPEPSPLEPRFSPRPRWACGHAPPPPRPGARPARLNSAGAAASDAQGPNCKAPFFSRVFVANQGHGCNVPNLCRVPGAKGYLHWYMQMAETCKIFRKSYKIWKIANSILLNSWWEALQLLLYSPRLFPNIFGMKNRNVKKLDLWYVKIHRSSASNFLDTLCVMLWTAPVPKIAQSYDVNLFIWIIFHLCRICLHDFCS
jgi:hypothetical protein